MNINPPTTAQGSSPDQLNLASKAKSPVLTPLLTTVISAAAGMSVANVYYNQPILGLLMKSFAASTQQIALVPFLTQMGYASGILLISPLGDRLERKSLILVTMLMLAIALAFTAVMPNYAWLAFASLIVGLSATVTQQLVPMAVMLAPPERRGKVIGTVTGGILLGVLLARTVSGFVSQQWSWQTMFGLASGVMVVTAAVLFFLLPKMQPSTQVSYPKLMLSIVSLFKAHPVLRKSSMIQALVFSSFMAFWCNLTLLLEQSPAHLGSAAIGMFGIIGAVGVLAAPIAGRLADRHGSKIMVRIGVALTLIAFVVLWLGGGSIASLVAGIVILDLGVQASQVSNQTRVYALDPAARSRLNTVFMTSMFLGGALGTAVSTYLYTQFGWNGVCGFAIAVLTLALALASRK
jgi:predicted MFS family arabinose efflux permease